MDEPHEYIADTRVNQFPDEPAVPGFRDILGNLIVAGDFVTIGTRSGNTGGVLVSRVEKIEPRQKMAWTRDSEGEWARRLVTVPSVTVKTLNRAMQRSEGVWRVTWGFKRASRPNVDNMIRYAGKVPGICGHVD